MSKLYVKLDETNTIKGYLFIKSEMPLHKTACNFAETDFEYTNENGEVVKIESDYKKAVEANSNIVKEIKVGKSKYINGKFIEGE